MVDQVKQSEARKLFKVEVRGQGWVPVWGRTNVAALKRAEVEYGEANVGRVRPEVAQ